MTVAIGNQKALTFPNAIDSGTTAERFAVDGFPSYILIDKAGKVVDGSCTRLPDKETIRDLLSAEVWLDKGKPRPDER